MESETKENDLSLQTSQNEEGVNLQNENNIIKVEEDKVVNDDKTVTIDKEVYEELLMIEELYEFWNSQEFLNNVRSDKKDRPLHVASASGNLGIVQKLVKMGHNVNVKNRRSETPLHRAAENNRLSVVKFLVENNAWIFAQDLDKCYTPLHLAISNNYIEIVEYLCSLKDSSHLHIREVQRRTPLTLARNCCHPECVKMIENRLKL